MNRTRYIAQSGMIAAVYGAFTLATLMLPLNLGWSLVQLRLSEAITVVAVFTPAAIPGLTLGSLLANAMNPGAAWPISLFDVVFGSLGTLLGAMWTWRFRSNRPVALLGPVISNALIVPAYLPALLKAFGVPLSSVYTVPFIGLDLAGTWLGMYLIGVMAIGASEALVVYTLGWGLLAALRRLGLTEVLSRRV